MAKGLAQGVEHLHCKCNALSSSPSTLLKKKTKIIVTSFELSENDRNIQIRNNSIVCVLRNSLQKNWQIKTLK